MGKTKDKDETPVPVPQAETEAQPDIQNDEFRGHGGSYVFDPVTGKRTRVEGQEIAGKNDHPPVRNDQSAQPETEAVTHEGE